MTNHCGTCTMCCKSKGVRELAKPEHVWCAHCKPGSGCKIYATRPESCAEYACLWLFTQTLPDARHHLPVKYRPDKTKVVVDIPGEADSAAAVFWVDPQMQGAMHSPENQFLIRMLATQHVVLQATGRRRKVLAMNDAGRAKLAALGYDVNLAGWEEAT